MKELFENDRTSVDKIPNFFKDYLVQEETARKYFNHLQLLSAKPSREKLTDSNLPVREINAPLIV